MHLYGDLLIVVVVVGGGAQINSWCDHSHVVVKCGPGDYRRYVARVIIAATAVAYI